MKYSCATARQTLAKIRTDLEDLQSMKNSDKAEEAIVLMNSIRNQTIELSANPQADKRGNARREVLKQTLNARGIGRFCEGRAYVSMKGNVCYYIDSYGFRLYPETYEDASNFREGRAWVKKDDKRFYIKLDGSHLSDEVYEYAGSFISGQAHVCKNGEWYHIDLNGDRIKE